MSLPTVKTLLDCADFDKTVLPYISQLTTLPQQLLTTSIWTNPAALKVLYLATNPLISAFAISLFLTPVFLVASEINRNYSQVDRFWSLLPTLYNAHFTVYAHMAGLPTRRLDTLLAFSTIWSARLTFNYWRKGGYSIGSEDYRWELLRQKIPAPLFFLLNVVFISLVQSVLLFSVSMPTYVLLLTSRVSGNEMFTSDLIFSRILVGLVLLEFFADQQQWNFQQVKKTYKETGQVPAGYLAEDLDRGFVVTGLWAWSRHPNFAAEQAVWIVVYQWSCYATDSYYNWTAIGAFSYFLLFQASTLYTESVSAAKYPEYKEYQQRVGKFLPRLSTTTKDEKEKGKGKGKGKAE